METSLFQTDFGYRSGEILLDQLNEYEVILTRDEYGNEICETTVLPKERRVIPERISKKTVWIHLPQKEISAEGFVRVGEPLDTFPLVGSGIVGTIRGVKDQKYPIYNPLTLHGDDHRQLLNHATSFLMQIVDEYLKTGDISSPLLDQTSWLLNSVLYVDGHQLLTKACLLEAVLNFCFDYREFPQGYLLRQPINYLFDIIGIDGIYSDSYCVSYVSPDFEGLKFH